MIAISNEAKELIARGIGYYTQQITMTLPSGKVFYITNEDILGDTGVEIEDATSRQGSLDVGSAIINTCRFTLMNFDDKFTGYEFYGANLIVKIGIRLSNGYDYLDKGRFTVTNAVYSDGAISITAYDNMFLFDRNYSESRLVYPATLSQIVRDACSVCGVMSAASAQVFDNSTITVEERPADDALTFREVISWCAQIAGCYARINNAGYLTFGWYDVANLGNDSGTNFHAVTGVVDLKAGTDDTIITGVRAIVKSEGNDEKDYESNYGTNGYVIEFAGNGFITKANATTIVTSVGRKLVGMCFRKMDVTHLSDPSFEAGDIFRCPTNKGVQELTVNNAGLTVNSKQLMVSKKGLYYWGIVSRTKFTAGGNQSSSSDSEEVAINSAARYSEITKATLANRKELRKELSERDIAIEELATKLANSSGLFITKDVLPDQSTVYYAHNKETLAESDIVWKFTAEAFAISTDGGQTYPFGFDAWGMAILNSIYTIGLNADYIKTGALVGKDAQGNTVFSLNAATGEVWINSSQVNVSGSADLSSALNEIRTNVTEASTEAGNAVKAAGLATTDATAAKETAKNASDKADDAYDIAQAAETNAKAFVVTLSRDSFIIPTASDGSGGDYSGCQTVLSVQWGATDVTKDAEITIDDGSGVLVVNNANLVVNGKQLRVYGGDITSTWNPNTFTYTVTESRAPIAVVTFTVTYGGKTVTKQLNVIKAMQGLQGIQGEPGTDGTNGKSITSVDVWYAVSTSSTIAPSSTEWSSSQPAWEDGKYIWFKTITAYSDGSTTESEPACITGSAGYTGDTGVGIDTIEEQYYLSTSDTEQVGGDWSVTPTWESGKYLWNRLKITYDDNPPTVKYTDPVLSSAINTANEKAEQVGNDLANLEHGGVNLIRVSNTLLFDNYYFWANLYVNGTQLAVRGKKLQARTAP